LLSFAQFEREIIAERTRDKMAATRRKGKWSGGTPVLGYDLDPRGRRLHVNDDEAQRVRAIFALYLEHQALLPVVQELARRGWVGKRWQTRHGRPRGGRPFTKTSLYRLLTNVIYAGKVRYKDEIHPGEQPALIDADTFGRVQALLRSHGPEVGPPSLHRFTALLKGLLRCVCCDCAMTPSHTTRQGGLRYRYYTCVQAQKNGWQSCPSKSIPAAPIEELVLGQIHQLGRDPQVLHAVLAQVRHEDDARLAELETERAGLERDLVRGQTELRRLLAEVGSGATGGGVLSRLAELQERVGQVEQRIARLRAQMEAVRQQRLDEAEATRALAGLDPAWDTLTPPEQARVVRVLVSRVDYDGARGKVAITFHPLGLKTLAGELLGKSSEEQSA
jgi:site-specific DNA recombinase